MPERGTATSPEATMRAVREAIEFAFPQTHMQPGLDAYDRLEAAFAQVLGWGDFRECSGAQMREFAEWARALGLKHLGQPPVKFEDVDGV